MVNRLAAVSTPFPEVRGRALGEWRDGWPAVVAGLFGFMLMSLVTMSMGAFMQPMQAAFGWSRSQFSLGFTIQMLPGLALPPLIGLLIDHWGPRLVAVAGAIV